MNKRISLAVVLLVLGAFAAGFIFFAESVTESVPEGKQAADGIVALTGGASRISDAIQLLANGRGKRLLVTGLNPSTSRHDLARAMGNRSYLVECCIDLDYQAVNTIGNAQETHEWAERNKFVRLIVVTSNYHMPRTLLELKRAFPDGVFIPHAVESPRVELKNWWMQPRTLRLLLGEYVKYLAALARAAIPTI